MSRLPRTLLVWFAAVAFALPLVWMLLGSVASTERLASSPARLLPPSPAEALANAARNYVGERSDTGEIVTRGVWTDPIVDFPGCLRNTLVVVMLGTLGMVASCALAAYGLARVRWRARRVVMLLMLMTMLLPFTVVMGPLYVLFRELGWIGTLRPLWVPAWFGAGFGTLLLRQYMLTLPRELDDAARLDGCSHWGVFSRIILPLCVPALAAVGALHVLSTWNDFLGPLIFLQRREHFTLALGLHAYQTQAGQLPWNLLMAACVIVVAPMALLFALMPRAWRAPANAE